MTAAADAAKDADGLTWLILVYQLPAQPAGLKAVVRRKVTAAGAVYLSRACAVAPAGRAERMMRRMRATIASAGGTAMLMRAVALGGEEQIITAKEGMATEG
jgi:hypothetical protein